MKKFNIKKHYNNFIKQYYAKIINYNYGNYTKYDYREIFILAIIVLFSYIIYLSLPAFYNYESFDKELRNKIYKDFKVDIKNIKGITYSIIPRPHLLIETSNLFLTTDSEKEFAKINNLKVFLSLVNLHNKEKINIKEIKINKANFYLNNTILKNFHKHFHTNIIKPIKINNSIFFYLDKNDVVTTISPIKKLKYFIDIKKRKKILNISGNLFDTDYNFQWKKDYSTPKILKSNLDFKNPNIKIINQIEKDNENNMFKGVSKTKFLNNELNIIYSYKENKIEVGTKNNKSNINDKIQINGDIDLNPFFFNLNLDLLDMDFNLITQKLFSYLYSLKNSIHPNFNGNLIFKISDLNNKLFENVVFNIKFIEKQIKLDQSKVNLLKIGIINFSNFEYIEKDNKLFLKSSMVLEVNDQEQFYKRFQISKKNRINLKKINFDLEKDIDENIYFISNIKYNFDDKSQKDNKVVSELKTYQINNIQQLTQIIKKNFNKIN